MSLGRGTEFWACRDKEASQTRLPAIAGSFLYVLPVILRISVWARRVSGLVQRVPLLATYFLYPGEDPVIL